MVRAKTRATWAGAELILIRIWNIDDDDDADDDDVDDDDDDDDGANDVDDDGANNDNLGRRWTESFADHPHYPPHCQHHQHQLDNPGPFQLRDMNTNTDRAPHLNILRHLKKRAEKSP